MVARWTFTDPYITTPFTDGAAATATSTSTFTHITAESPGWTAKVDVTLEGVHLDVAEAGSYRVLVNGVARTSWVSLGVGDDQQVRFTNRLSLVAGTFTVRLEADVARTWRYSNAVVDTPRLQANPQAMFPGVVGDHTLPLRFFGYVLGPEEVWTVPINPNRMTSPFAEKNVSTRQTTAVDGKVLLFEGNTPPVLWTFGGAILDHAHYAELLRWVRKRNRVRLRDHFGREFMVYLTKFDPEPKRARNRYWRHDYSINALVLTEPSAPTVGV